MATNSSTLAWKLLPCLETSSHCWRSLVGYSSWGREESDTTEQLHFSLSCIGDRNGNPLQCSCLENPRDRGACWAAVYGVAQSQTRLEPLSSSSSREQLGQPGYPFKVFGCAQLLQSCSKLCSAGADCHFLLRGDRFCQTAPRNAVLIYLLHQL